MSLVLCPLCPYMHTKSYASAKMTEVVPSLCLCPQVIEPAWQVMFSGMHTDTVKNVDDVIRMHQDFQVVY